MSVTSPNAGSPSSIRGATPNSHRKAPLPALRCVKGFALDPAARQPIRKRRLETSAPFEVVRPQVCLRRGWRRWMARRRLKPEEIVAKLRQTTFCRFKPIEQRPIERVVEGPRHFIVLIRVEIARSTTRAWRRSSQGSGRSPSLHLRPFQSSAARRLLVSQQFPAWLAANRRGVRALIGALLH
jgi:hypothetical protein